MNRAGLKGAAEHTGLTIHELRTGALSGRYPYMRIGGPRGKFWFDLDLLDATIERLMKDNVASSAPVERDPGIRPVAVGR